MIKSATKTMKTRKLSLAIALLFVSAFAFAQKDFAYKVMANKGSNEVKSGDTWQPLKTGASLKPNDELKLSENSYLGLISAEGQPVEIRQVGNVKVADIKVKPTSSALNKYTDFILSSNAETKKNKLGATGAVVRDVKEAKAIMVILPEKEFPNVYNSTAVINWDGGEKVQGPYIVTVKDLYEEPLAKFETPEVSYKLDLDDPRFAKEGTIFVEVSSKADPKQSSSKHYIKRMPAAEKEKITKLRQEIIGDVSEESPLNKIFLARFYEENGLLIDAIGEYEQAVKLAPDVPTYKEYYDDFLYRRGMRK
jgi:hypothetical protein